MKFPDQKVSEKHDDLIAEKIFLIRDQKVMIDRDLSELYGVATKVLKQAVRRNIERFPTDFMFEITPEEYQNLRSQIVTSSWVGTLSANKYLHNLFNYINRTGSCYAFQRFEQ